MSGLTDVDSRRPSLATLVIPARNESRRIGATVRTALHASLVGQVIVVDDDSLDGTLSAALEAGTAPRLQVLRTQTHLGKAGAVLRGIRAASTEVIAFIDADLTGLTPEHIDALIRPVLEAKCEMTLGLFHAGRFHTDLAHRATPFLSGQRCLHWDRFTDTPYLEGSRYGAETALSLHARVRGLRVHAVRWEGVSHVTQTEKHGALRGYLSYLRMYAEILAYLGRIAREAVKQRRLPPAWSARIAGPH